MLLLGVKWKRVGLVPQIPGTLGVTSDTSCPYLVSREHASMLNAAAFIPVFRRPAADMGICLL